jgi:small conductance mechanosensitive channel
LSSKCCISKINIYLNNHHLKQKIIMEVSSLLPQLVALVTQYGGKIILAVVVFLIGRFIIKKLAGIASAGMERGNIDKDLRPFLLSLISVVLTIMLVISVAGILGVETSSFVAIMAAAGLAVGLALQGSLANFAGGVLLLIFKPFRVGDLITAEGFTGHVESIQVFNTVLLTLDNKTIILPNGPLSTAPITNISTKGEIRVDMVFTVGSPNGVDKARQSINAVIAACPYALKNREHDVLVTKLTENSISFDTRVWTKADTYWETYYNVTENISRQFTKDGIVAPAPAPVHVVMGK